jgi:threonine dehydratase
MAIKMDLIQEIKQAALHLRPCVRETPLDHSLALSQQTGAEVYLKLENLQHTGSFKVRSAINKLLTLTPEEWARGVVTEATLATGVARDGWLSAPEAPGLGVELAPELFTRADVTVRSFSR